MEIFFAGALLVSALSSSHAASFAGHGGHGYPSTSRRFNTGNTVNNRATDTGQSTAADEDALRNQYLDNYVTNLSPQDQQYTNGLNGQVLPQQNTQFVPQQNTQFVPQQNTRFVPQQSNNQQVNRFQQEQPSQAFQLQDELGDANLIPLQRLSQGGGQQALPYDQQGFGGQQGYPQLGYGQQINPQQGQYYPPGQQRWGNQGGYLNQPMYTDQPMYVSRRQPMYTDWQRSGGPGGSMQFFMSRIGEGDKKEVKEGDKENKESEETKTDSKSKNE